MKKQSGFTLIELLLVLAIIGIIAAIAIPALLGQREKAKAKAVGSLVANIAAECTRVNDDLREKNGTAPTAASVVAAVKSLPNYQYPAVKNPYGGGATPYTAAAAPTTDGEVSLDAQESYTDPAVAGNVYKAIVITGQAKKIGAAGADLVVKVVALD